MYDLPNLRDASYSGPNRNHLLYVIFCLLSAQNASAFVVSPATVDAYKRSAGGMTFTPSAALPVVNGVSTVSSAAVEVGGATRYLPMAARFGSAAATVAARSILANPYVMLGTAAYAYYQSRGVSVVDQTLRKSTAGHVFEGSTLPGMRGPYQSLEDYESALRAAADAQYSASLLTWVKDFKCVQSQGPKGPYRTDCTFTPMYIWDRFSMQTHYAQAVVSPSASPVTQSSPPATVADMPTSAMPPYYDVPTPLPVAEPMVLNPSPQAQSQPFEFRSADSVQRADGKYVTTVVTATAAGNATDPSLIDLTSRQVVSDQPSTLTDAKNRVLSSPAPLDNVAGVPGQGPQPSVIAGKDGAPGKDGEPGKDAGALCELFPAAAACAELDAVDDGELGKKAIDVTFTPWGSWGGAGACPADVSLSHGVSWSYKPLCEGLGYLRYVIVACAYLSAAYILVGARSGGSD